MAEKIEVTYGFLVREGDGWSLETSPGWANLAVDPQTLGERILIAAAGTTQGLQDPEQYLMYVPARGVSMGELNLKPNDSIIFVPKSAAVGEAGGLY